MAGNFNQALQYVLKDEGGNSDDPRDHGGRTSRGITQRVYDSWCRSKGRPQGDVWRASDDDVRTIYHDQYWLPYCDQLPSGVDYIFFDISVNAGRQRAVTTFQKVLGVKVDGMMGTVTLDAIQNTEPSDLIQRVSNERRRWYKALAQFPIYGRGWLNRVDHSEIGAQSLLEGRTFDKPSTPTPKTTEAKPNAPAVNPETSGGTTGILGTLTAMLNQLKEMLEPYQYVIKPVMYVCAGLTLVAAGYTAWSWYKQRKIQQVM